MSLVGKRFGRWLVESIGEPYIFPSTGHPKKRYNCICDCGKKKLVREDTLLGGESQSCGCLARELASDRAKTHGFSKHILYRTWFDMIRRCTFPDRKDYKHYGGRGISVCDEWLDMKTSVEKFIEDMFPSYIEGLELDRIDVNGNYCKENCRWADRRTQVINRRPTGKIFDTHILEFDGKALCLSQWEDETGINKYILSDRVTKLKWSVEKALTTPVKVKKYFISVDNVNIPTDEVFRNPPNLYKRAKDNGVSIQEFMSGLFYSKFKLVGIVNKRLIEFKPVHDFSHLLNLDWLVEDFVNIAGLSTKV